MNRTARPGDGLVHWMAHHAFETSCGVDVTPDLRTWREQLTCLACLTLVWRYERIEARHREHRFNRP